MTKDVGETAAVTPEWPRGTAWGLGAQSWTEAEARGLEEGFA